MCRREHAGQLESATPTTQMASIDSHKVLQASFSRLFKTYALNADSGRYAGATIIHTFEKYRNTPYFRPTHETTGCITYIRNLRMP